MKTSINQAYRIGRALGYADSDEWDGAYTEMLNDRETFAEVLDVFEDSEKNKAESYNLTEDLRKLARKHKLPLVEDMN